VDEELQLIHVEAEESAALQNLWQLYKHDLAEFRDSSPDADGRFTVKKLEECFGNRDAVPLLFLRGSVPVGFAVVFGITCDPRKIGEFFVVRGARNTGIGLDAATRILRMFPGRWEIAFQEENPFAARFWRRVASTMAPGAWTEEGRQDPRRSYIPPDRWISLDVPA
jgi:predicted acetyltransferase